MTTHPPTPAHLPAPGSGPAHAPAGSGVHVLCLRCHHPNAFETRFCGQCGSWLGEAKQAARAEAQRIVAAHAGHATHDRSPAFYFAVFMALSAATIFEILLVEFVPIQAVRLFGLFSMSTVKFFLVAMFFMHLKGDKRMYGAMFSFGVILAGVILLVLKGLFTF